MRDLKFAGAGLLPVLEVRELAAELIIAPNAKTGSAATRFEQLMRWAVSCGAEATLGPAECVAISALAFDAVPWEDFTAFLDSVPHAESWGERVYATWERDGVIRRRALSPFSVIALRRLKDAGLIPDWNRTVEVLCQKLARWYDFQLGVPPRDRLRAVSIDAMAWHYKNLPMVLIGHILGRREMTALPSRAWLRRYRLQDSEPWSSAQAEPSDLLGKAEANAIEALYESPRAISGAWFAEELAGVCTGLARPGVKKSNAAAWREIAWRLEQLAERLSEAGPVEALLLGWALDIARFGSAKKLDPRVKTLDNYLRLAVPLLHKELRAATEHPLSLTPAAWEKMFKRILADNDQTGLKPALSSFQRYLVRSIDADPLPWLFRADSEVRAPRANVVWEHEFERLGCIVASLVEDQRVVRQLAVWTALLRSTPLRFGELIGLQLRSIRDYGESLEVEVAPHRGHRPVKSQAARRIVNVTDPGAREQIREWLARRQLEAASPEELLFGNPYDDGHVYRLGACYQVFSQALKIACGDDSVCIHSTRHSFLSRAIDGALQCHGRFDEINPIDTIRVAAGHSHELTTLTTYAHLHEVAIRAHLDRTLASLPMTYAEVAAWTNQKADTLRQRFCRQNEKGWTLWSELSNQAHILRPTPRELAKEWLAVEPKDRATEVHLKDVCHIAQDLVAGLRLASIACRIGLGLEKVNVMREDLHDCAVHLLGRHGANLRDGAPWQSIAQRVNFSRLAGTAWQELLQILDRRARQPNGATKLMEWLSLCRSAGINLAASRPATDLLELLREAGFEAHWFVLREALPEPVDGASLLPAGRNYLQAVLSTFSSVFGAHPQIEQVSPRRGRPAVYAQVLTKPIRAGVVAGSAACDMASLRAALWAAAALAQRLAKE